MINPSAAAFLEQAIEETGVEITLTRVFGFAPTASTFSVNLKAKVALVQPDAGAAAREHVEMSAPGAVTENSRVVILAERHLRGTRFPLPIQKGDKVLLPATSELFDVARVDPYLRAIAGGVTLTVTGVS
jgi:hypothetical protein